MRTRNALAAMVVAIVAMIGITVGPAHDQSLPAAPSVSDASGSEPGSASKITLGVDDKLKISFFETIDVASRKPGENQNAAPQGALRTFYQRMDLSGEYVVDHDGWIAIPILGKFRLGGRGLDDVRSDLITAFSGVTKRTADVSVTVVDRPPVYVVGPVKNPGAYKYVPGMIVLHAVALAGGHDRGESGLSNIIEGVRETERLHKTSDQIQRLFARRARLEAQRAGLSTVPIPVQLAKVDSNSGITAFLSLENTLLRAESAKRQEQENELTAKIVAASREVDAFKRRLGQADVQRDMRAERLDDLQKLKDRGVVSNNTVIALRTELADIEARREEYAVAVIQAESRLTLAEKAKRRFTSDEEETIAKNIAAVDQEIADARGALDSSQTLATILINRRGQIAQTYQILRQTKDGAASLAATEVTPLKPGDVLKVEADKAEAGTSVARSLRARAIPIAQQESNR